MELTKEQTAIINSTGNIKINAVAGSGKTSTIIEYAASRPRECKILYLAFNKSVKLEAAKKFACRKLFNVKVETAHSLSYRHVVSNSNFIIRHPAYTTHDLVDLLNIQRTGEGQAEFIIANHIKKFTTYFCNSDKEKVQDLNYLDIVSGDDARLFVSKHYTYIENHTRSFLNMMNKGDVEITHDFHLKKFQLSDPKLNYDYILFDEGQDASAAMLDVFLKQKTMKVIVGDTHQQIYSWRFAVNSLEKADFTPFLLSSSFRFRQDIADIAVEFLKYKKHINNHEDTVITGMGNNIQKNLTAVLARSNLGLLQKAIEHVSEKNNISRIFFEGNINSYTYADEGASLYDVLHLYNRRRKNIRDKIIRSMKDIDELEQYSKKTEDVQMGMMIEIIKKYGNEIPGILQTIKDKHVKDDEREKAEIIFSTVHRCKGMEYDEVYLANDFITEGRLKKLAKGNNDEMSIIKLNEEINLLYVAVTRTKNILHIPKSLMPENYTATPQIQVILKKDEDVRLNDSPQLEKKSFITSNKERKFSFEQMRKKNVEAYNPWTEILDRQLMIMFGEGKKIFELAKYFGRSSRAIEKRLQKLGLYVD